jgi:CRISPR-associated protein Cas2
MFMLMTYDVEARRTQLFRKILRRYLNHEQFSVFTGDITEAEAIHLRHELGQAMIPTDRLTEVTAANRNNVTITHLVKPASGKGDICRQEDGRHKHDFGIL